MDLYQSFTLSNTDCLVNHIVIPDSRADNNGKKIEQTEELFLGVTFIINGRQNQMVVGVG